MIIQWLICADLDRRGCYGIANMWVDGDELCEECARAHAKKALAEGVKIEEFPEDFTMPEAE